MSAYLLSGNATDAAIKAGYSRKTAYSIGQENLKKPVIKTAIAEVIQKAMDATVAAVRERMQILTKIIRATMADFVTAGAHGVVININPENINSPALKRIRYVTMPGSQAATVTYVEVRDQIAACHQLNLMTGAYDKHGAGNHPSVVIVHENELRPNGEKPPIDIPAPKQIAERGAK